LWSKWYAPGEWCVRDDERVLGIVVIGVGGEGVEGSIIGRVCVFGSDGVCEVSSWGGERGLLDTGFGRTGGCVDGVTLSVGVFGEVLYVEGVEGVVCEGDRCVIVVLRVVLDFAAGASEK
jgi:hypothetical protein